MRLLLVSQEYPPETAHGGIATQTHAKAHGLASLGHEVTVLSHAAGPQGTDLPDGPVRVVRRAGPDAEGPIRSEAARWIRWSTLVAGAVDRMHEERPFDLVDFPEWGGEGCVWLLGRPPGAPKAVVHVHGPLALLTRTLGWPEPGSDLAEVGAFLEGGALRRADAVYSSSRFSARVVSEVYGIPLPSMAILHVGVDTARFRPPVEDPTGAPVVLFVGRISRSKGADVLVDAALGIASRCPGLRVRMIGRDEGLAGELRRRAADAGFPGLLDLPGFVPRERLPEELARATVFAAPSPCEGGPGFVVLEAMACGRPVVVSEGTGLAESVEPGRSGLVAPVGDAAAWAGALEGLLRDPARRRDLGGAARRLVEGSADERACLRRLEAFYGAVVAGRPSDWTDVVTPARPRAGPDEPPDRMQPSRRP